MDKRALSAIPRPALTDKNKEMLLLVQNMYYLVTASRRKVNGTDTLIMNFFRAEGNDLRPEFRTFCQMDDYISQDLTTDRVKWKTGAINHLAGYLYWHRDSGNIVIASVRERRVILGFLRDFRERNGINDEECTAPDGTVVDSEVSLGIDGYQDTIKSRRLRAKHKKEMDAIDLQMAKFGGLPADYSQFVKDTVFRTDNYIFYSRAKGRAFCSKCGHDLELRKDGLYHKKIAICNDTDQIRHNRTARCPYCNDFLVCKSEGMGRNNLFSVRWSVLVQKSKDKVLVRYFCHTKDFRMDFKHPLIESREKFRTVHGAEKAMDFEWDCFKNTTELRWCFYRERSYGYTRPPETVVPRSVVLYNRDILDTLSNTCMRYSAIDIYMDKVVGNSTMLNKPWCIDWYFNAYREKPYLEQLLKVGFYRIAQSVLENRDCPMFKNGRTVMETLGVNKLQFNMLRAVGDPTVDDVKILRYAKEISQGDFEILHYKNYGYTMIYKKYIDMRKYTTIYKVDKYIRGQKIAHDRDYFDYITWLEEMGYDMRNKFNLFPRDFRKAHAMKSREYIKFKDKQAAEDEKRFCAMMEKMRSGTGHVDALDLRTGGMFIRFPEKLDELKREGEVLHHCVGTYRDKVAKGDTMILFIRLESEPDRPFFTLEWKGRVIQCRGFKNCDMTPEVKAFVKIFQEKMEGYGERTFERRKAG